MKNINNIIVSVLHLKEISDILGDIEPEISLALLELSKKLLDAYEIPAEKLNEANELIEKITEDTQKQE